MKIRVLIGKVEEYDTKSTVPVPQAEMTVISFPMTQDYYGDDQEHPDTVVINNDEELREWAEEHYYLYEISEWTIPEGAALDPEDQDEIRRHELAEALQKLSTVYDSPKDTILDTLEHAQDIVWHVWRDGDVPVDELDVTHTRLTKLVEAANLNRHLLKP